MHRRALDCEAGRRPCSGHANLLVVLWQRRSRGKSRERVCVWGGVLTLALAPQATRGSLSTPNIRKLSALYVCHSASSSVLICCLWPFAYDFVPIIIFVLFLLSTISIVTFYFLLATCPSPVLFRRGHARHPTKVADAMPQPGARSPASRSSLKDMLICMRMPVRTLREARADSSIRLLRGGQP